MAPLNKFLKNLTQKLAGDSTSWGALAIWICGLGVLLMMMVMFSHSYPQAI